jgi:hypothetical protein
VTLAWRPILAAGWGTAAIRAGIAFGIMLGLGLVLAALQWMVTPDRLSLLDVPRTGALIVSLFHRVPIVIELPTVNLPPTTDSPFAGPFDVSVTFSVILLGAAIGAGWLLFRGGRAAGEAGGGPPWARAVHGLKVAPPYALLTLLVSLVATLPGDVTGIGGGRAEVHPSIPGSFLWPLLLASALGAAGGLWTARDQVFRGPGGRRAGGVLAGGWRMLWLAMALGSVGFLVLAALNPETTRVFLDGAVRQGPAGGALVIAATLLFLPNVGAAAAAAAMGGSIDVAVLGSRCVLVSLARFPSGPPPSSIQGQPGLLDPCVSLPFGLDVAPPGYFLFLLVPVVATVAGGWWAARRGEAVSRGEAAGLGAGAGLVFAALFPVLLVLSGVSYEAEGPLFAVLGGGGVTVGAAPVSGFLLGLVWGMGGGALGGFLWSRLHTPTGPGDPGPVHVSVR